MRPWGAHSARGWLGRIHFKSGNDRGTGIGAKSIVSLLRKPEQAARPPERAGTLSSRPPVDTAVSLDQSSAENPLERFRRIELYIRWMEESAAPEAPDSEIARTQLRNLDQNFTPLVSPFLGPGAADSVRL
jgi:hypothetical protein